MNRLSSTLVCNAGLLLSACSALQAQDGAPAVIVHSISSSRAELSRAVSDALNGRPVVIADDALTHDSILWIERTQRQSTRELQANGRDLDRPDKFQLIKQGTRCVLIHERTGHRRALKTVSCKAL